MSYAINELFDRVLEAADSPKNLNRLSRKSRTAFALEEPIAWTNIFPDFNVPRYSTDPKYYVEQVLRQKLWRWDQFPDDEMPIDPNIPAWLGHYPEYTFVGLDVENDARGVPVIQADHPLTHAPDVRHLPQVDFHSSGMMPKALRWFDSVGDIVGGRGDVSFAMTWWRGCLDIAVQLRGFENFIGDTTERPVFVHELLGYLTEQRCRWHKSYCEHFSLAIRSINIADDWLNVPFVSPAIIEEFVLPRYLEIDSFHGGITGIHSCGNQTDLQPLLLRIKSLPTFEVSSWTDLHQTLENIPPQKHIHISLHPNEVLCASPKEMENRLQEIATSCGGRSYSVATAGLTPLSHDTTAFTEKIRAWNRAVEKELRTRVAT